jgi:hypothetical protein
MIDVRKEHLSGGLDMKKFYFVVMIALLLASVALVSAQPETRNFRAHLSGDEEIFQGQVGVDSQGQGQAIFQFSKDGSELRYKLIVANLDNVVGAHIHIGAPGTNGPILVGLFPDPTTFFAPDPGVSSNGVLAEGVITEGDLTAQIGSLAELRDLMQAGQTYVNVHTTRFRSGEIRGQIH